MPLDLSGVVLDTKTHLTAGTEPELPTQTRFPALLKVKVVGNSPAEATGSPNGVRFAGALGSIVNSDTVLEPACVPKSVT